MIKYKTESIRFGVNDRIDEIMVERETDSSVWIRNRRELKACDWHVYHDSWKLAYDYLVKSAIDQVKRKENELNYANESLSDVLKMEEPND
jgi:hypothetical protein